MIKKSNDIDVLAGEKKTERLSEHLIYFRLELSEEARLMVNWRNYFGYSLIFCAFLSMIDGRPNASSAGVARYGDKRVRERDAGTEVGGEKEKLAAESVAASVTASGKRTANKKQGKKK